MPGTNAGTGEPIAFKCAELRRTNYREQLSMAWYHRPIARTGRTKPYRRRSQGIRTMRMAHEYRCHCGHVGWTAHSDILRYPLVA